MDGRLLVSAVLCACAAVLAGNVEADSKPDEYSACLKRTELDRETCQSGCGMILQQCYDEANDALLGRTTLLLSKARSPACADLEKRYADGAARLADAIARQAEGQPGWLSAELKMQLMQQRYDSVMLIDRMCK